MKKEVFAANKLLSGSYVRAINYHNTSFCDAKIVEAQMKFYQKYFSPVTKKDLEEFFITKVWKKKKPGLIISLFEGYRNNYDVAAPILEKYGFTGWFFIPTEYINTPIENQKEFAREHSIDMELDEYEDNRYALTWDEIRNLGEKHVIASHTRTHYRIKEDTTEEKMADEIINSKKELEEKLQTEIAHFCWLGGEEFNYNPVATKYVVEAGYRYLFSNSKIEKIR